ncbi:acyl-CoA thioesterase [Humidesulfovibrio sp.]|uniref:acyl-CoA thioesterase n=1 Tax=Humidesulfovibrio sp. TaxID=2910988 RepID=UPI0039C89E01
MPDTSQSAANATQGKTAAESAVTMSHQVLPHDANPAGNVHGGVILKHIDTAAGVVAMRHVRGWAVTASIDRMDFLKPVFVGELVTLKASLNMVGRTSMEIGVRVEAENLLTGEVRHTNSAYLTFVALDEHGNPRPAPPLILKGEVAERRYRQALRRRELRWQAISEEKNG